jgi:hypothetical protein
MRRITLSRPYILFQTLELLFLNKHGFFVVNAALFSSTVGHVSKQSSFVPKQCLLNVQTK